MFKKKHFFSHFDEQKSIETIRNSIKKGINYIDTAPYYGQGKSEETLGKALKTVPRKAYFIATKVGRYGLLPHNMFDFSAKRTIESVDNSLKLLGLDYVDVIQIHDIEFAPNLTQILNETLPTLEKIVREGKAKHIGVTSYSIDLLKKAVLGAPGRFEMIISYARNTLVDNSLEESLKYFDAHKIGVVCAAGHAMGLLTNAGPQDWHPAKQQTKEVCWEASLFCKENGVELGKLAMYHCIQLAGPATFLIGMQTDELVDINLSAFYDGLSDKEMKTLNHLKKNVFSKVKENNWEGVEVERFWADIKK